MRTTTFFLALLAIGVLNMWVGIRVGRAQVTCPAPVVERVAVYPTPSNAEIATAVMAQVEGVAAEHRRPR